MTHILAESCLWWMLWNMLEIYPLGPGKAGGSLIQNCLGKGGESCWYIGDADHHPLQAPDTGVATHAARA